ncbi:hypothetical protein QBC34DRAFT_399332 [Podospora aff. communis PSN243]|uniref:FHA domain-containing protein n=1 Tax=Podospora aff. communis PSN243 TaxID=3040156 RepID=A0AAV9GZV9_9PEZI|nr:hypothetical protein QBC34DRAFT_399332 [Podospora aff. communis PSN243]
MWLLESELFDGRKLWLRPGKRYLFGRTASEPGQLAISDKTISRQHLTITVEDVAEGGGQSLGSRSRLIVEDLDSKKGTFLNGRQIRGLSKAVSADVNELKLAACPQTLKIVWQPVVLSFSFTSKELRADPWATLRGRLEQLDIKYSSEFEPVTTHVVSKKRNTPKGLQALINGKYLVTDSFINAIVEAALVPDGEADNTPSPLEEDFTGKWPNPIDHLPPRGEEPSGRPPESYAPNPSRQDVFDGYTFVFYDKKQYDNLFPVITHGKGKALYKEVTPNVTNIDDFVRFVKEVAGEKGLGSFEDGSEGKGVVVVRFTPAKGDDYEWFASFFTSFAQRLDHRPIDQREFLEAILACDASMLRRPLQEDTQPQTSAAQAAQTDANQMGVDQPESQQAQNGASPPRRGRSRRAVGRFKGFDLDSDPEDETPAPPPVEQTTTQPAAPETTGASQEDSLFVSQRHDYVGLEESQEPEQSTRTRTTRRSQRKRAMSPLPEHDESAFLDGIAPAAAAAKRRRIDAGKEPIPPPDPEPAVKDEQMSSPPRAAATRGRKSRLLDGQDILELARERREEEEKKLAAEKEELERVDDDIDYAAIRALHIVEECTVHFPEEDGSRRTREQDIASGRWDPRWNGRKNFKRFRMQGDAGGRPPPRIILSLEEVKPKEYGIGDDYWLEHENSNNKRRKDSQLESQTSVTQGKSAAKEANASNGREKPATRRTVLALDSSDEEDDSSAMLEDTTLPQLNAETPPEPPRSRAAKAAEREVARRAQLQSPSQSQPQSHAGRKRPAAAEPAGGPANKKTRGKMQVKDSDESGDSDDELKFRFGRRRA